METKNWNFLIAIIFGGIMGIIIGLIISLGILKYSEWQSLKFTNYCYEHEILEPVHEDWVRFRKEPTGYYNQHIKNAQMDYDKNHK